MGIIKAAKLAFDYLRYDEDGNVEDTQRAVDGVDLDIQSGEFVAVLGHNGSGKSTFAKHINALLLPTEGTIWIDGIDTAKEPELWKIRQKAGMVFQNPDNQIIGTVVEEDVGFGPENMGISTGDIWKRVDESLAKTGMTAYRHHSPNKLSGGQKQRVAIAGVMAMRPQCIVLDEPTAMLDPNGRKEVLEAAESSGKCDGRSDHTLHGRSDRCRSCGCHGWRSCRDGGNSEGDLFTGGDTEEISSGCAAGNAACT